MLQIIIKNILLLDKIIDKQRNRKYINVYLGSLKEFYNLTNNEKNVLLYINSIYDKTKTYFISNYKDKHNNNIKGCYVIK